MRLSYCEIKAEMVNDGNVIVTLSNKEQGTNVINLQSNCVDEVVEFATTHYTPDEYSKERVILILEKHGYSVVKFDTPRLRIHKKFVFRKVADNETKISIVVTMEKLLTELNNVK